jgi:hypothetical protein
MLRKSTLNNHARCLTYEKWSPTYWLKERVEVRFKILATRPPPPHPSLVHAARSTLGTGEGAAVRARKLKIIV